MLRTTNKKSTKKSTPRRRPSKQKNLKNKVQDNNVEVEEIVLNDIMDKEDKEAEIILNDLVPERDKSKYGIKQNNTKSRKGRLKLNLSFLGGPKKSNRTSKSTVNNKNQRRVKEETQPVVEDTKNDDLNKTEE